MGVVRGMCMPSHLRGRARGRGWAECDASGFVVEADNRIDDVRQGLVRPDFADVTEGFGTYHPNDVRQDGPFDDPTPIENARPPQPGLSKQDLAISDAEVLASVREGRPPRPGY